VTDESFRFFVDQVVRQYQELKIDIKNEVGDLRRQLAVDSERVAIDLRDYKASIEKRFRNIERQLDDLKQFRWTMAGAAAVAFGLAEVAIRALEWWLQNKH
jgi:hypothetical protein